MAQGNDKKAAEAAKKYYSILKKMHPDKNFADMKLAVKELRDFAAKQG
jgi:hypothetical protein